MTTQGGSSADRRPDAASPRDWLVALIGAVVAAAGVALAILQVKIDEWTAILIVVGAVLTAWPALAARISKLSIGKDGFSLEMANRLAEVEAKTAGAQTTLSFLSQVSRPQITAAAGERLDQLSAAAGLTDLRELTLTFESPRDDSDPNKGKFGGSPRSNGRVLKATVQPHPSVPAWGDVELRVEADAGAPPITSAVTIHLHPSFKPNDVWTLNPSNGGVTLDFTSYGAFTVGVDADGGLTKLELDLVSAVGHFPPWEDR